MTNPIQAASDWGRAHLAEFDEGTLEIYIAGGSTYTLIGYAKIAKANGHTDEYYVCLQSAVNKWSKNRHLFGAGDYKCILHQSGGGNWAASLSLAQFKIDAKSKLGTTNTFELRHQKVTYNATF